MKKHLLFILVLLFTLPSLAQVAHVRPKKHGGAPQQNNTLTVLAPRGQQFWLYVDDVLQNESPVHSICIRNLWNDDFYVRIELDNLQQNCVGQFINLSSSQKISIVQSGTLYGLEPTQANIRPVLTMDLITQQPSVGGNSQPPMPPAPPMPLGMNPQDYDAAYQLISKESFDSSRLSIAKQVVSSNPMNASQILEICKIFSFESNKLDFAKYAYSNCVDKNRYYLLNEAFSYESSKRELDEFIKGQ